MADVPSNLIPTRLTQLPLAPVADADSLMMIVYQGNNYQIRVGDLLQVAGVPPSRQVLAGTGLQGGGALSANVTLSIAPGGVGSAELAASGVTPGSYGSATTVPVFTVDDKGRVTAAGSVPVTVSGYVPETRQVLAGAGLTGGGPLNSNVTLAANLSNAAPLVLDDAGSAGVSNAVARADHQHPAVDLSDQQQVNGVLPLDQGGTSRSLVPAAGAMVWCGADGLYVGPVGAPGQVLVSGGEGAPSWGSALIISEQAANVVWAGPESGPDANPSFRALVNADIPTTLSGKTISGADNTLSNIGNASLTNSQVTINGTAVALGASATVTAANPQALTIGAGLGGVSYDGSAAVTITNTAPDQVVSLAAGTGVTVTGVYPSFTVTNTAPDQLVSLTPGTGLSVTGAYPSFTLTNTAPDQTVALTGGGTTTVTGTYPNFTISSADQYTGTVTSVATGTGLTGGTITTSGTIGFAVAAVGTWAATPSSANLAAAITDETGSGALVFANGPSLSAPNIDGNNPYVQFSNGATVASAAGRMWYDGTTGSLNFGMGGGQVTQQVGEEIFVYGKASATITEGQVVAKTGTVGASGVVTFAPAPLATTNPDLILGVATENIASGGFGRVTRFGVVRGINTSMFVDGDSLYYDPAVVGGWTKTKPSAPNLKLEVATVINAGAGGSGSVFVALGASSTLGGTDANVQFGTLNNGDIILYDASLQYWKNAAQSTLAAGSATTATHLAGGAASQLPYQTAPGATAFIANGTAGQVLTSNGAAAPSWSGVSGGTF